MWKRRFACLAIGMRLKLKTVITIIVATAVLHNIARLHGADMIGDDVDDGSYDDDSDNGDDDGFAVAEQQRNWVGYSFKEHAHTTTF